MQNQVKLSIVMPVYNHTEEVSCMIHSILENDFQDWELLLVDDGSETSTIDMLESFANKYPNIKVIQRTISPKGAQTCRNIGLQQAKGEYTIFFDSDDYITPSCLSSRVCSLDKREDLDFMVFPSLVYLQEGIKSYHPGSIYGYPIYPNDIKAFIRRTLPFIVWSNIYRTSSLRKYSITWDTTLLSLQDSDFNLQAILKGLKYDYAHVQPDYAYRIINNEGSISKRIASKEHLQSQLYLIHKTYKTVQTQFGNKFNTDLFLGVLLIYNKIFANGIEKNTAIELINIINEFDSFYGRILNINVRCSLILQKFIAPKRARQLTMLPFLIYQQLRSKVYNKRIQKIVLQNEETL